MLYIFPPKWHNFFRTLQAGAISRTPTTILYFQPHCWKPANPFLWYSVEPVLVIIMSNVEYLFSTRIPCYKQRPISN